jgi:hypothetical protein
MSDTAQNTSNISQLDNQLIMRIADVCFEMFSIQELKRPVAILREIALSFPEATAKEIQEAIKMAISWRRALRGFNGWTH